MGVDKFVVCVAHALACVRQKSCCKENGADKTEIYLILPQIPLILPQSSQRNRKERKGITQNYPLCVLCVSFPCELCGFLGSKAKNLALFSLQQDKNG